jgi:prevent-host-death family protein
LTRDHFQTIFSPTLEVITMSLSKQIKPISYLKANAAKIAKSLAADGNPLLITQNGEVKMVVQDINSFEETQETLALLKILALGQRQIEEGRTTDASEVIENIGRKHGLE